MLVAQCAWHARPPLYIQWRLDPGPAAGHVEAAVPRRRAPGESPDGGSDGAELLRFSPFSNVVWCSSPVFPR